MSDFENNVLKFERAVAMAGEAETAPAVVVGDPEMVQKVNMIRLDGALKAFERKREISRLVLEDLSSRGRMIRTGAGEMYFFDNIKKALGLVAGEEFRSALFDRFGLNPTEEEARFIERDIITAIVRRGERAEVRRLSYWDDTTKTLCVSIGDGGMYVLDGKQIFRADNGHGGVLFLREANTDPVLPDLTAGPEHFDALFQKMNLSVADEMEMQGRLAMFKVWALAVFFLEALPVRPILALVGEQGSGKTTFARRLGMALFGRYFDVGSFRSDATGEQDFLAAATSKRLVVYDNADERIRWLPDHLAKIATGSTIERRKLYTTNDLVSFKPDCFLIITSRDPRWRRDDVARRLLVCHLDTLKERKIADGKMRKDILENRPRILGATLGLLNGIVREIRTGGNDFSSNHRLADFHWFGRIASKVLGVPDEFERGMAGLDRDQLRLLADGDERLALLAAWLEPKSESWEGEAIAATVLYDQLHQLYRGREKGFPFRSPTALGTWLGRHGDMIESELSVRVTPERSGQTRAWKFDPVADSGCRDTSEETRCHGVTVPNPTENKGLFGDDTMTPSFPKGVTAIEEVLVDES